MTKKDTLQIWFDLLKTGFNRKLPQDPVSGVRSGSRSINLGLLKPYLKRHWRKEIVGAVAILFTALLAFPLPLITRFLVDKVILGKHLEWLIWAVLGLAAVKGISYAAGMVEQYTFSRLQANVTVDLQETLLNHTLALPKAFFDDKEIGYMMSRVSSDVNGLTWFFSQTAVYIFTHILRFIGGIIFLIILEWRLALATLIVLPLLVFVVKIFTNRMRALSHQSMERRARMNSRFQETLSSIPLIKSFTSEKHESQRVIDEVREVQQISMEQTVLGSVANSVLI